MTKGIYSYILPVAVVAAVALVVIFVLTSSTGRSAIGLATGESIQCTAITSGEAISGTISSDNAADCYSISKTDEFLAVALEAKTDSVLDADLYAPSSIVTNENTGFNWVTTFGLGTQKLDQQLNLGSGDYKIKVWSYEPGGTGTYELTATLGSTGQVPSFDMGMPSAGDLTGVQNVSSPGAFPVIQQSSTPIECSPGEFGVNIAGIVSPSNLADCYTFNVDSSKEYSVELATESGKSLDADVYSPGVQVTTGNTGYTWVTTFGTETSKLESITQGESGVFSVKVWSYVGSEFDGYDLQITESDGSQNSGSVSNTPTQSPTTAVETCVPLQDGVPSGGLIDSSNQYDCLTFSGDVGDYVKVKITSEPGKTIDADIFGPDIEVTPQGSGFAWVFTDEGSPGEILLKLTEGSGTYSVKAWSYGNWSEGKYDITVTKVLVPDKPTNVSAVQIKNDSGIPVPVGTTTVTWVAPATSLFVPITKYEILSDGYVLGTVEPSIDSSGVISADIASTKTIGQLALGKEYKFTVKAHNIVGAGLESDPSESLTLLDRPSKPSSVKVTPGDTSVSLVWQAPFSNGGVPVTAYKVLTTASGDGSVDVIKEFGGDVDRANIEGLKNGTSYKFEIFAINKIGDSPSITSEPVIPVGKPGMPEKVSATPGNGLVVLTWGAPTYDGGTSITGYKVKSTPGSTKTISGRETTTTLGGLLNGIEYVFSVQAINSVGDGPSSPTTAPVKPKGAPSAPINVKATSGDGKVTVKWGAPLNDGGDRVSEYSVKVNPGRTVQRVDSSSRETEISGLTNGTSYSFTVTASNKNGSSDPSIKSDPVTPVGPPSAPQVVKAISKNESIQISWSPPSSDGGGMVSKYQVTMLPGNKEISVLGTETSHLETNLINGKKYTFTVKAFNSSGGGEDSLSVEETPATTPGKPTGLVATSADKAVKIQWQAPLSNGGKSISSYIVKGQPGNLVKTTRGSETEISFDGLINGSSYVFTIQASNAAGVGDKSEDSTSVVPVGVPDAPFAVSATGFDREASISWSAPRSDGGSSIQNYLIISSPDNLTVRVSGNATTTSITGLTNGTSYSFTVEAINDIGSSKKSISTTPIEILGPPSEPTAVTAEAGDSTATLTWKSPSDSGGRRVSGYRIMITPGRERIETSNEEYTFNGLVNGQTYRFDISAINEIGVGSSSSYPGVRPIGAPTAPTEVSSSSGSESTATVLWKDPVSNGGSEITKYVVTSNPGSIQKTVTDYAYGTTYKAEFAELTNGVSYTFTVRAFNYVGKQSVSRPTDSVTPVGPPAAPAVRTASYKSGVAKVGWSKPDNNGGTSITSYTVVTQPEGKTTTVSSRLTEAEFTGLTKGTTYKFKVAAVNDEGTSKYSDLSDSVLVADPPGQPRRIVATPSNSEINVSWSAPDTDGGSSITGYTVQISDRIPEVKVGARATSAVVKGLSNGVAYSVNVVAENSVGTGVSASASTEITPYTLPEAPTGINVVAGNESATVSWSAPRSDGGSAITSYNVSVRPGRSTVNVKSDSLSTVVSNLTNGTAYSFVIAAVNAAGTGKSSEPSADVKPVAPPVMSTVPGSPTAVDATVSGSKVTVTWIAPDTDGGDSLTGYKVVSSPGAQEVVSSQDSLRASYETLEKGVSYTFTVVAINSVGDSSPSRPSGSVLVKGVPDAPSNVIATASDGSVDLTWDKPASDGGSSVNDYKIIVTSGRAEVKVETSRSTTASISGLTNGTAYSFTVKATNSVGDSPESRASSSVTPTARLAKPGSPTGVAATPGDGKVTVVWTAPSSDGGTSVTGYKVIVSPDGTEFNVDSGRTTSLVIDRLTNGKIYTFTVVAINSVGNSPASRASQSVRPVAKTTVPDQPTRVSAVAGDGKATISWTAPSNDGGSSITGYTVSVSPGRLTVSATSRQTSVEVTGLSNGTAYTFSVAATNEVGTGKLSIPSDSTTPQRSVSAPDSPTGVLTVAGDGQVTVSWSAPSSDGGSTITKYLVTVSPGREVIETSSGRETSVVVSRLTNGTAYQFTVKAVNSVGSSADSRPSSPATPKSQITVPGVPTDVAGLVGDASVDLSWSAPSDDGGSAITGYEITVTPGGVKIMVDSSRTLSKKVTGLTNGTSYTFVVKAKNEAGNGSDSTPSSAVVPKGVPNTPTGVSAVGGNGYATVSWTAPSGDGGSPITGYKIKASVGGQILTAGPRDTSIVFTRLTNNTQYTFTVVAENSVGSSSESRPSSRVTPSARFR